MSLTFIRRPPGLQFGGIDVRQLADRAGRTPFFAYDRSAIDARVQELRSLLPSGMRLHYSIKANPMPAVIHYLAHRVDGFDVASAQEMALALDAGTAPDAIGFAGPGKSRNDLRRAVASGVNVHVESETQLRLVTALGWELGVQPSVAVACAWAAARRRSAWMSTRFRTCCANSKRGRSRSPDFTSSGARSAWMQRPSSRPSAGVLVSSFDSQAVCRNRCGSQISAVALASPTSRAKHRSM